MMRLNLIKFWKKSMLGFLGDTDFVALILDFVLIENGCS